MLKVGYIGLGLMGKSMARNILEGRVSRWLCIIVPRLQWMNWLLKARQPQSLQGSRRAGRCGLHQPARHPRCGTGGARREWYHRRRARGIDLRGQLHHQAWRSARHCCETGRKRRASLDAPVSGGDIGARNGTLTIMVGGDADALEKVMPVFQAMGKTITHVGDAGAGQMAKACNQIMVAAQMVAMAELLIFSKKAGVDPQKVVDAIKAGAAQCWTLDVKPPRLFEGNRQPGFKAYMQAKDLNIVMESAREYGAPLPSDGREHAAVQCHAANGHGRTGQFRGYRCARETCRNRTCLKPRLAK